MPCIFSYLVVMIKLYVLGFVGNLGTKVLIDKKRDELVKHFNSEFILHVENELEQVLSEDGVNPSLIMPKCMSELCEPGSSVVDIEQIGKGGILASLWKICDRNKWGLRYNLRQIPILQGTVEIANHFDINPYRLLTNNAFLVACRGELHESAIAYIGDITNEKKRIRIDGEAEAFLTKDYKDEIDKIIPNYTKTI